MQDQSRHLQYIVIYILLKTEHRIFLYMLYYAKRRTSLMDIVTDAPWWHYRLALTMLMFICIYTANTCVVKTRKLSLDGGLSKSTKMSSPLRAGRLGVDIMVAVAATPGCFWQAEEKLDKHWK